MREMARLVEPEPVAAHEWEPRLARVFLATVAWVRRFVGRPVSNTVTSQGEELSSRRLVGIDLGIASAHTVRVLDETGKSLAKRKAWPTEASLSDVEKTALVGTPGGTVLEVVMEPTGPAWLPIAVFFTARGHRVYRVSSAKAADLRRFLSRHTKTNGIDADTLARLPIFDPDGLHPLVLPGAEQAALDRRVRATDRLTRAAAEHKRRINDLVRQLLPMTPLTGDLGVADLAVLDRYATAIRGGNGGQLDDVTEPLVQDGGRDGAHIRGRLYEAHVLASQLLVFHRRRRRTCPGCRLPRALP